MRRVLVVPAFVALVALAGAQPVAPGVSNWQFDEITLKNGAKFQGLILNELPDGTEFRSVYRNAGKPTVTLTSFFSKNEIAHTRPLTKEQREALKEKLDELDPSG